jgi:hypothetical protein
MDGMDDDVYIASESSDKSERARNNNDDEIERRVRFGGVHTHSYCIAAAAAATHFSWLEAVNAF